MRKLLLLCTAFSCAVFAAQYILPVEWLLAAGGGCLVACGVCAVVLRGDMRRRTVLLAAGAVVGCVWSFAYHQIFFAPAQALDGRFTAIHAAVLDYPKATMSGYYMTVRIDLPDHPAVNALLYTGADGGALEPGDRISALTETRLSTLSRGEENKSFAAAGIFLVAVVKGSVQVLPEQGAVLAALPAVWGRALEDMFRAVFSADTRGLATAIVTGNTDGIEDLSPALRRTGLAHAVSVSGMHVAFLTGLIAMLVGGNKRRAAAICIPVILLFVAAVGCPPAAVRAAVMHIILLLAPLLRRESDPPTALAFALFLLLAQNPFAAAGIGLQLSFAATVGIVLLSTPIQTFLNDKLPDFGKTWAGRGCDKVCRFVISVVAVTLGAVAFTTPLTALYFNMVSLVSPLASLVTTLAVTVVFLGGLAAGLLGMLWLPLGKGVALLVSPVVHYLQGTIISLAGLPLAAVTLDSVFYGGWLILCYAIAGVTVAAKGLRRPLVPLCCCAAALVAAALFTRGMYRTAKFTVTALDVGQGQCIILHTPQYTAIVDCGGTVSGGAGDAAAAYLEDAGIARVDALILTHYHADHANGVAELMRRLEISTLLLPDVTPDDPLRQEIIVQGQDEGAQLVYVDAPAQLAFGGTQVTVFPPLGDGGGNEEGLTVLGTSGEFDVLITGDMNAQVEAMLTAQYTLPDIELLVVGHHGSKHSTSAAFLQAVTPEYAFISAGRRNTYGHPTPETMLRLDDAGAAIYRTDLMGTVRFFVR